MPLRPVSIGGLAHNPARWLRIAAIRVVAVFFALFAAVLTVALLATPIATLWPEGPITVDRTEPLWWYAILVLFAFASARTSWLLWRRRRTGGISAVLMFASVIVINYYGPLKGTQAVGFAVAMLALLLIGWRELE
jgi:hypothetical protein